MGVPGMNDPNGIPAGIDQAKVESGEFHLHENEPSHDHTFADGYEEHRHGRGGVSRKALL
jgi:hypothetical protein